MSRTIFSVERARSGRSKCKGCGQTIPQSEIRLGIRMDIGDEPPNDGANMHVLQAEKWYHLSSECIQKWRLKKEWWTENRPAISEIKGLDSLDCQPETTEALESIFDQITTETTPSTSASRKRSPDDSSPTTAAGSPPKKQAKQQVPVEYECGFLSPEDQVAIREQISTLRAQNMTYLKDKLKSRCQRTTGRKDELLERLAECIHLGAMPKCPKCERSSLKRSRADGSYSCAGGLDNGQFKSCSFKAAYGEIELTKSNDMEEIRNDEIGKSGNEVTGQKSGNEVSGRETLEDETGRETGNDETGKSGKGVAGEIGNDVTGKIRNDDLDGSKSGAESE